jgi:hypothetical protein
VAVIARMSGHGASEGGQREQGEDCFGKDHGVGLI